MQNYYSFSTLIAVLSMVAFVRGQDTGQKSLGGVEISYSLPQRQLTLHEPVTLTFKVKNTLPQPIKLDLGQNREAGFSFTLRRPDGALLQSPSYVHEGISLIGTLSLKPNESLSQDWILNERFDFVVPGKYELEGHLTEPILTEDGRSMGNDPGFRRVIDIARRDIKRLQKVCSELSDQIEQSSSYAEAARATRALSYVVDPVAVPFLNKALTRGHLVETIAISGLERIANQDAAQALISVLTVQNRDTALLARAALGRIEASTRDRALRELIERALRDSNASPET